MNIYENIRSNLKEAELSAFSKEAKQEVKNIGKKYYVILVEDKDGLCSEDSRYRNKRLAENRLADLTEQLKGSTYDVYMRIVYRARGTDGSMEDFYESEEVEDKDLDFWNNNLTTEKYRVEIIPSKRNVVKFYTYDVNAYKPEDIINSSYLIATYYLDTLLEDPGNSLDLGSDYVIDGYDWQEVLDFLSSHKQSIKEAEMQSLFDIVTDEARKHNNYAHYSNREVDEQDKKNLIKDIKKKGGREVKPNVYVLEDFIYDLNDGITVSENNIDEYKVEPIKEAAGMPSIVLAEPNYTGGGIYVYTGKLSDGNYFMAEDSDFDREDKSFMVLFVNEDPNTAIDPETGEDLAWFWDEWQKPHLVKTLDFGPKEASAFTKQLLEWIIKNKPDGNYAVEDMEKMLDVINDKN